MYLFFEPMLSQFFKYGWNVFSLSFNVYEKVFLVCLNRLPWRNLLWKDKGVPLKKKFFTEFIVYSNNLVPSAIFARFYLYSCLFCSIIQGFPYWEDGLGVPQHQLKICSYPHLEKYPQQTLPLQTLMPPTK